MECFYFGVVVVVVVSLLLTYIFSVTSKGTVSIELYVCKATPYIRFDHMKCVYEK